MGYVAYMAEPDAPKKPLVTTHRRGHVVAIIAEPGWTEKDWDAGVPKEIDALNVGEWNFRIVEDCEVWTIDLKEVNRI